MTTSTYGFRLGLSIFALAAIAITSAAYVRAGDEVCWATDTGGQQCAPLSIVQATFQGWQPGTAPPTNQVRQELVNLQSQLAETLRNFRQCEGILGPLQAASHQTTIQQQQELLNTDNAKAAPAGMAWDPKTGKYVPVSPANAAPAPGGRGGADRR